MAAELVAAPSVPDPLAAARSRLQSGAQNIQEEVEVARCYRRVCSRDRGCIWGRNSHMRRGAENAVLVLKNVFCCCCCLRGRRKVFFLLPCLCIRSRICFGASDSLPSWFRLWVHCEDGGN